MATEVTHPIKGTPVPCIYCQSPLTRIEGLIDFTLSNPANGGNFGFDITIECRGCGGMFEFNIENRFEGVVTYTTGY